MRLVDLVKMLTVRHKLKILKPGQWYTFQVFAHASISQVCRLECGAVITQLSLLNLT